MGLMDFARGGGRGLLTLPEVMGGASVIRPKGFTCLIPDGAFLFSTNFYSVGIH